MRKAAIITIAVALSSCTTTSIDTTIQNSLPKACALLVNAHAAFNIIAETGKLSDRAVRKENAAYQGVAVFCDNPSQVTTANALVLVAGAYAVVAVSLKDARAAQ